MQQATVYVVEDQTIVNGEEYEIEHPAELLHKQWYEMGVGERKERAESKGCTIWSYDTWHTWHSDHYDENFRSSGLAVSNDAETNAIGRAFLSVTLMKFTSTQTQYMHYTMCWIRLSTLCSYMC